MIDKDIKEYFSKLGKKGGKNRWKGKSKGAILEHMKKMAKLSHEKRYAQSIIEKS